MATYGSADGVLAIVPSLGEITEDTTPSLAQINTWLAEGKAEMDGAMLDAGYVLPDVDDVTLPIYPRLTALNNLYAAAYAMRARHIDPATGQREPLSETYLKDFYRRLKLMVEGNLTYAGLVLVELTAANMRRVSSRPIRRVDGYSEAATPTSEAS